jgi:predicted DNA-binding protein (UPF0251 family)
MKRLRITQEELESLRRIYAGGIPFAVMAQEMGVEKTSVYHWLRGTRNPSYLVTTRIRTFLKQHTMAEMDGEKR